MDETIALFESLTDAEKNFLFAHPEFEQKPVDVKTFITHPGMLNCEDAWPEVVKVAEDIFKDSDVSGSISRYKEFVADEGIGSGKSFLVSIIFTYGVYWLECLENPQQYFGLAKGSTIALLNMSKTAMQAKKVVFGDIKARIDNSPWFQTFCKPDPSIHSELRFPKNIVIFPGNSSETFPLGYNVFMANMDEASFYTETSFHDVAQEIYDALDRRITSRFGDRGFMAITSSPRYVDDFTEKKVEEAKTNLHILAIRRATWDMKPDDIIAIQRSECFEAVPPGGTKPVKIPLKYQQAFKRNPKKAWRDFGGIASLVLEGYFSDEEIEMLDAAMHALMPAAPVPGHLYFIHIDLGLKRDACGFAMTHEENGVVFIDRILRITSRLRAEQLAQKGETVDLILGNDQVDIGAVEQLVYDLGAAGYPIGKVTFDQFQSAASRQNLEKLGYPTDHLSVAKNTDCYDTFKTLLRTNRIRSVYHAYAIHEAKRSELVEGKKIDHPPNGSNDVIEAIVGAVQNCMAQFDEEVEVHETVHEEEMRQDITPHI